MPTFPSLNHVAVTVSDLDRSRAWYAELFGAAPVLDEDTGPWHHAVWALGNTLFGIHSHHEPSSADAFDERRPGLDHVGFGCASRAELQEWVDRLSGLGIEHGGIVDAHYGSGVSFRDPDGNALEFFAPPE